MLVGGGGEPSVSKRSYYHNQVVNILELFSCGLNAVRIRLLLTLLTTRSRLIDR